jgi:hypothetical protein
MSAIAARAMSSPTHALLCLLAGQNATISVKRLFVVLRLPRRTRDGTTKLEYLKLNAALMLDQLIFWSGKPGKVPGWVYKSHQDWWREVGLQRGESDCATRRLEEFGLIRTQTRVPPGHTKPVRHYQVCWDVLEQAIASFTGPLDADEVDPDAPPTAQESTFPSSMESIPSFMESLSEDPLQKDLKKEEQESDRAEEKTADKKPLCRHPPHERLPIPGQDMTVCLHCYDILPPDDLPPPPDPVTLHASVLWCPSCQHATPVVLKDATYYCLHCGTPTGKKEGVSP